MAATNRRPEAADIGRIQCAIREAGVDGWLFCDFQGRDPITYRILGVEAAPTRRWFYWIPCKGQPRAILHAVEPDAVGSLPGGRSLYRSWQELASLLRELLRDVRRVAMQYSPLNSIPYVSTVDAGTIELVRTTGAEIVTSADLVQRFEAIVSPEDIESHAEAARRLHRVLNELWKDVCARLERGDTFTEYDVLGNLLARCRRAGLTTDGDPLMVAVGGNTAHADYVPTAERAAKILPGQPFQLSCWARLDRPGSIYYDVSLAAFTAPEPPELARKLFRIVRNARDAALEFTRDKLRGGALRGYEVDKVCRGAVSAAGFGDHFIHRAGHSIGTSIFGRGVNIDNLETQDERRVLPGSLFSLEPGIYLPEENLGVRTTVSVWISPAGEPVLHGESQSRLLTP